VVTATEAVVPPPAWPMWTASNHDAGRFPTRWCGGDERKIRAALLIMITLRGTPILYYGDEIGLQEVDVPKEAIRDPVGLRGWPDEPGRDPERSPMPWTAEPTGGFTAAGVVPWLPIGTPTSCNVADQREDPASVLHLCRDLIALRRANADLRSGAYVAIGTQEGVWAWRRGDHTVVAVNGSDHPTDIRFGGGEVLLGTRRERDGQPAGDQVTLEPWEAVVLRERPAD